MRVCSLFCGIGGIDLEFIQASFEIVWANEFDEDAARTYRYNFKDCNLVVKNIKKLILIPSLILMCLQPGFHVSHFHLLVCKKVFKTLEALCFSRLLKLLKINDLKLFSLKM